MKTTITAIMLLLAGMVYGQADTIHNRAWQISPQETYTYTPGQHNKTWMLGGVYQSVSSEPVNPIPQTGLFYGIDSLMVFTASNYLDIGDSYNAELADNFEIWFRVKPTDGRPATDQSMMGIRQDNSPLELHQIRLKTTGVIEVNLYRNGMTFTGATLGASFQFSDGSQSDYAIVGIYNYGGVLKIRVNGAEKTLTATNISAWGSMVDDVRNYWIGARNNPTTEQYFGGNMTHVYMYSDTLSASDRTQIENYLLDYQDPLIAFIGVQQSNGRGKADTTGLDETLRVAYSNIYITAADSTIDPYVFEDNHWGLTSDIDATQRPEWHSYMPMFLESLNDYFGGQQKIAVIHAGRGASALYQSAAWDHNVLSTDEGHKDLLKMIDSVKVFATANNLQVKWYALHVQGETDAIYAANSAAYYANLVAKYNDLKANTSDTLPTIIARMSEYIDHSSFPYWATINTAFTNYYNNFDNVDTIRINQFLFQADSVHYTTAGYNWLGTRFFEKFKAIYERQIFLLLLVVSQSAPKKRQS